MKNHVCIFFALALHTQAMLLMIGGGIQCCITLK